MPSPVGHPGPQGILGVTCHMLTKVAEFFLNTCHGASPSGLWQGNCCREVSQLHAENSKGLLPCLTMNAITPQAT